jgi:hypothetical protein
MQVRFVSSLIAALDVGPFSVKERHPRGHFGKSSDIKKFLQ